MDNLKDKQNKIAKHKLDDISKIWLAVSFWNITIAKENESDVKVIRAMLEEVGSKGA